MTRRRGFTLIELMIAILIIAVLVGLLLPALAALRRQRAKATTQVLLEHLTLALTEYLDHHPVLGDAPDSADFAAKPWMFLSRRPRAAGEKPYLELKRDQLGAAGGAQAAGENDAETILDAFGQPIVFAIVNGSLAGRAFTTEVTMTSGLGTAKTSDDVGFRYTATARQWDPVRP